VSSFLTVTYLSVKYIDRINSFIVNTSRGISKEKIDWKNLDQRTREWYTAIQIIKSEPVLGVGIAKIDNRMVAEYRKNGFNDEADLNLNAHNQFLEAQMTFGIAGVISLLWMLLTPVLFRKQIKYPKLAIAFILIISFYLLFESMLNRQWGIMFFLLFYYIEVLSTADSERRGTYQ
jgi:O-antigen ligase